MKRLRITVEGKAYEVAVEVLDDDGAAPAPATSAPVRRAQVTAPAATARPAAPAAGGPGSVPSPLAGKVVSVDCKAGQVVKSGEKIVTLEAMKMNTVVSAPADGTVKEIHIAAGDAVEEGQALITIE